MKNATLVLFSFLIFASFNLTAKTKNDTTQIAKSEISSVPYRSEIKIEGDYYKQMYENEKGANSKLLSLLTTSLTVIIGVILAIIGSTFFYNYRFNKKEYELLNKENKNQLEDINKRIIEKTQERIDKIQELNKSEIAKEFSQLSETYKTNFETVKDSYNNIIASFKSDIERITKDHSSKINSIEEKIEKIENAAKEDLKSNAKSIRADILDLRGKIYGLNSWFNLALITFTEEGLLCIETNQHWKLQYIAKELIVSINKTIEMSLTISSANKLALEKLLRNFPDDILDKRAIIEEKLNHVIISK